MIDYARISTMIKYEEQNCWPISEERIFKARGIRRNVLLLAKKFMGREDKYKVFQGSTRYWEYPWVTEQIAENVSEGARILDCGCGTSRFPIILAERGFTVYGLDFFVERQRPKGYGISPAHRRKFGKKVTFVDGDMYQIPLESDSFDVATCISVMEHIVNKTNPKYHIECLKEMKRVLKPGGLLICTYDTFLNPDVVFAGDLWGKDGWYYLRDIEQLDMKFPQPDRVVTREDILADEDTFYIDPRCFFNHGYGEGFNIQPKTYYKMTSVGFVLVKD